MKYNLEEITANSENISHTPRISCGAAKDICTDLEVYAMKQSEQLKLAMERFSNGESHDAYQFMGCHRQTRKGQEGYVFRVWAPHAKSVRVTGRFNDWDKESPVMELVGPGIWERFIPGVQVYDEYKYYIERPDGSFVFRGDPYGFHTCTRPETATLVYGDPDSLRALPRYGVSYDTTLEEFAAMVGEK